MKTKTKCLIIILLTVLLYANTLFHDYTLDDTLVITENEYTISGLKGLNDIFAENFFSGLFDRKNTNLVAGGRYRPLSMATFAIEWQIVMGTAFDGIEQERFEQVMNKDADPDFILPSQSLLKNLTVTIHEKNRYLRNQKQDQLLNQNHVLSKEEKNTIRGNLERMHSRRGILLFISHFFNMLLYGITALLLFIVLEKLLKKYNHSKWFLSVPFVATLLFLFHPLHTEVVANIKGRDEILSLLGSLLAFNFVMDYIQRKNLFYLILIFFSFLIGIFSKEIAIVFLAIIPLSIYYFADYKPKLKIAFISAVPMILASVIYLWVRHVVLDGLTSQPDTELMNNSFLGMNIPERYATIFYTLLLYLKLLLFPHPLTFDYYPYHISVMNWSDVWPVISVVLYVSLGIVAIQGIKRKSVISYGILFYFIALSPVSNVLFPIGVFMNERFLYVASIGFVIVISFLLTKKLPAFIPKTDNTKYAIVILLLLFTIKTISRNNVWKDDLTLFTHDVKISKNSAKSNTSAGGKLMEEAIKPGNEKIRGQYLQQSVQYLKKAISIHPSYREALLLLGNAQWELYHSLDSAYKYYEPILKLNPDFNLVYTNIFNTNVNRVFEDKSKADQNIIILKSLEKYSPNNYYINYYLGRIYGRFKNDLQASKQYFEKALAVDSSHIEIYKDLGVVYGMMGAFEQSAKVLEKANIIDPADPVLNVNIAMTYLQIGNKEMARSAMDKALQMNFNKNNAGALINLGNLYQNMGESKKANICFVKAQNLNPELFIK